MPGDPGDPASGLASEESLLSQSMSNGEPLVTSSAERSTTMVSDEPVTRAAATSLHQESQGLPGTSTEQGVYDAAKYMKSLERFCDRAPTSILAKKIEDTCILLKSDAARQPIAPSGKAVSARTRSNKNLLSTKE